MVASQKWAMVLISAYRRQTVIHNNEVGEAAVSRKTSKPERNTQRLFSICRESQEISEKEFKTQNVLIPEPCCLFMCAKHLRLFKII